MRAASWGVAEKATGWPREEAVAGVGDEREGDEAE